VRSLASQTRPVPIVVVDNGSSDESLERVRAEFPDVDILSMGTNLGFGPALNRAVRQRASHLLIFLNDDVECQPTFVEAMLEELSPATAMVAGVLLQGAAPQLIDSAGIVVDSTLMAFDYLHGEPADVLADAPAPLGPTGGAALFRSDAFNGVRGFDERMFAYLEDVDLMLRLRRAGAGCRLAPEARAVHRHSTTLGSGSATKNWHMGWSRGYLLRRYGILRQPHRAVRALAAEAVICGGQAVIDRTLTGVAGRIRGWRAAGALPGRTIRDSDATDMSLCDALARRSRRRSFAEAWQRRS
jgi:N-acetylglucosaminyl-diphospho-decaprenol L-rhamnosyltransferase